MDGGGSGRGVGDPTQREDREMERTLLDLLFATLFGVVVFLLPLGLRLWQDRAHERALALRAEIHYAVRTALGGESYVSIHVVPAAPWRRGRVELSVPLAWEWLIEAVLDRVVERTPANYDVMVRLTGRRVEGATPRAAALKAAA